MKLRESMVKCIKYLPCMYEDQSSISRTHINAEWVSSPLELPYSEDRESGNIEQAAYLECVHLQSPGSIERPCLDEKSRN